LKAFHKLTPVTLALFVAVLLGAVLFALEPLPLQVLRNAVFDQYQRWHPRPYRSAPVRIVDLDEESLGRLGQWPWPRTRVAEMIGRLQEAGAAAIGLDIVFAEASRGKSQEVRKSRGTGTQRA
jgi:adenylate cyclase